MLTATVSDLEVHKCRVHRRLKLATDFTMRDHLSSEREENNLALSICTLLRFPGDPRYEQAT